MDAVPVDVIDVLISFHAWPLRPAQAIRQSRLVQGDRTSQHACRGHLVPIMMLPRGAGAGKKSGRAEVAFRREREHETPKIVILYRGPGSRNRNHFRTTTRPAHGPAARVCQWALRGRIAIGPFCVPTPECRRTLDGRGQSYAYDEPC